MRITLGELKKFSDATKIDPLKLKEDDIWPVLRLAAWLHGKKTEREFNEFLDLDTEEIALKLKETVEGLKDFFHKITLPLQDVQTSDNG
jgi:hypothetical protein